MTDTEVAEKPRRGRPPKQLSYDPDPQGTPYEGPEPIRIECAADLQDTHVTAKSNGATYDVIFEIPLETFSELVQTGDGHDVTFKGTLIGQGGTVRRYSTTRDADGRKHGKIVVVFAASEIKRAVGKVCGWIADGATMGQLVMEPMQMSLDLTSRAE